MSEEQSSGGEFEREPVPDRALLGAGKFWGMYAGEHAAGTEFMIRSGLLILLGFFGYQTPNIRALQPKVVRERFEEILLGLLLGLLNGYLLFGSIWYYLHKAGYEITTLVTPPQGELAEQIAGMVEFLPPSLLRSSRWAWCSCSSSLCSYERTSACRWDRRRRDVGHSPHSA